MDEEARGIIKEGDGMNDADRKERLKKHVETLKEMRETMLNDENWEIMKRLIEACTAGAMAIQRVIREDFGESEATE